MNGDTFAAAMAARVLAFCAGFGAELPAYSYVPLKTDAQRLRVMQSRLYNEVRAAEVFGAWLPTTPELDIKEALAESLHGEMTHARLLAARIRERGVEPFDYRPVPGQIALFNAFQLLPTTVERFAAFPLAGEGVAEFMIQRALAAPTVPDWIKAPYQAIHADEADHANFPAQVIARFATTPDIQDRAQRAVTMSLALRRQYFADLDAWVLNDATW